MSKLAVGVIGGTLGLGAVLGGGYAANKIYNNLNNGNPNSNVSVQQANTNTANSNVNTAQPFKNNLLGTWIIIDNPNSKFVFTADEINMVAHGKEIEKAKYQWVSANEILTTYSNGFQKTSTVTIAGDEMTFVTVKVTYKLRRETGTVASDNKEGKIKEIEKKISGTWIMQNRIDRREMDENGKVKTVSEWYNLKTYIFGKNLVQILQYNGDDDLYIGGIYPYRVNDENSIQIADSTFSTGDYPFNNIHLEENGEIVFDNLQEQNKVLRKSDNSEFENLDISYNGRMPGGDNVNGIWVSDDDKLFINVHEFCRFDKDGTIKTESLGGESYGSDDYFLTESNGKITPTLTTLKITDKNGVEKNYTRLTDWAGENYLRLCRELLPDSRPE